MTPAQRKEVIRLATAYVKAFKVVRGRYGVGSKETGDVCDAERAFWKFFDALGLYRKTTIAVVTPKENAVMVVSPIGGRLNVYDTML